MLFCCSKTLLNVQKRLMRLSGTEFLFQVIVHRYFFQNLFASECHKNDTFDKRVLNILIGFLLLEKRSAEELQRAVYLYTCILYTHNQCSGYPLE